MNVASGYSIASNYGGYGAERTSSTNTKPFTIPNSKEEAHMIGQLSFVGVRNYSPFKDIAETGSVNFPKLMQTKTTPTRSDEEILKELEELAKEHARTGEFQSGDKYFELLDEYVSSVSPDRAGILKSAVAEINERLNPQGNSDYSMSTAFQQINSQRTDKTGEEKKEEKEPIDYFLETLKNKGKPKGSSGTISSITKNGDSYSVNIDHGGGMTTTLNYANGEFASMQIQGNNYSVGGIENGSNAVTYAEFYDDNGKKTMFFNGNDDEGHGLKQAYTEAEGERSKKLLAVYNAAYNVAAGRH